MGTSDYDNSWPPHASYYDYCPWHDRECVEYAVVDSTPPHHYTLVCMVCGQTSRANYPYQGVV